LVLHGFTVILSEVMIEHPTRILERIV